MSKRMQILMDEREYRDIQRTAKAQRMTVAEWVRQALRAARRREPEGDVRRKLDVIRESARHSFPSGDIGQILSEIEQGYLADRSDDPD